MEDAVDAFITTCLCDAELWHCRESDGLLSLRATLRDGRVRARGRVWTIDQTLHSFWLDIAPDRWTLYFDIDATSIGARRARNALDVIEDPDEVEWRFVCADPRSGLREIRKPR